MQWKYSLVKLWHSCAFVPHMWSHLSPFSIRIYVPFFLCLTSTWSGGFETRFWPGRLSFSEFCQRCSFSAGQVFLSVEALLQLTDLHSGERRTGFLSLRWCAVLVRVTNTPSHGERRQGCYSMNNEGKTSERWDKSWRVWHTAYWPPSVKQNIFY